MKKILSILFLFLLIVPSMAYADNVERIWPFTSLTGSGSGSLDGAISGVSINPNDMAFGTYVEGGVTKWALLRVITSGAAESSPDIISPDDVGAGVTRWRLVTSSDQNLRAESSVTFTQISASRALTGASIYINKPTSGTSVQYLNTLIYHDTGGSSIYGLPPISGVSVPYVKFVAGPSGGGITVYNANKEPFLGDGLSGVSYLALPPGKPLESATVFGITSGTSIYWFVEATSSWTAGD